LDSLRQKRNPLEITKVDAILLLRPNNKREGGKIVMKRFIFALLMGVILFGSSGCEDKGEERKAN